MVIRALPSLRRPLALLLLAVLVVVGCKPDGGGASPTSAATMAVARTGEPARARTGEPAPSDDGATAGEPGLSATVEPVPTAAPTTIPPPEVAEADREPFAMNLFRTGDFVAQYTFEWCVGASLQMALNMATD
jgi:hypothetical protein